MLAITEDGGEPMGEVLIFPTDSDDTCELAYAVGIEYRGHGLAARAVRATLPLTKAAGYKQASLKIAVDNKAGQRWPLAPASPNPLSQCYDANARATFCT